MQLSLLRTNFAMRPANPGKTLVHLGLCGGLLLLSLPHAVCAQIIQDNTLPNNSVVNRAGATDTITGGTTVGGNLFHSFSQFNIRAGETAFFNNGVTLDNIITRVTGGQISNLDGTLRTNGAANFFLINPSGIIFGRNARLEIGGSFFASTADRLQFSDGSFFSATVPNAPPLLTVNVPVGLQLGANPGSIISTANLSVAPGQILALIGGDVSLEGGNLTASGGQIELGSAANSTFNLNSTEQVLANRRTIQLLGGATVNTSGFGGGAIRVRGGQVILTEGSKLVSDTFGNFDGGGIDIQATQFKLNNGSYISTSTFLGAGNAGNLKIQASDIQLSGLVPFIAAAQLLTGTFDPFNLSSGLYSLSGGSGAAGKIQINADRLSVDNGINILTTALLNGAGGDIAFSISQLAEFNTGSLVLTGTAGSGDAGDLTIRAGQLRVLNGTALSTTPAPTPNSTGRGGNLNAIADSIELRGTPAGVPVPGGFFTTTLGLGDAGNLNVQTRQLIVADGAQVSAASAGAGRGGDIWVTAESVELSGISDDGRFLSGLFASTALLTVARQPGDGGAGDLTVNAQRVSVRDGAQISVATGNEGSAGKLRINASEFVEVRGVGIGVTRDVEQVSFGIVGDGIVPSAIESNTSGAGSAGNVEIHTGQLTVRDGAEVGVRGTRSGAAGNLEIEANSILLDNQGTLSAATNTGAKGDIRLQASSAIVLRRNSRIVTDAGNTDSGNIAIHTGVLVAPETENSDITANAQRGRGGRAIVKANGIFGPQFRQFLTPESDITATSELGPEFSGVVDIQTLALIPTTGLEELPDDVIDPEDRIASGCAASAGSRFVITGRGGLPEDPTATIRSQTVWNDLQDFARETEASVWERSPQSPEPRTRTAEQVSSSQPLPSPPTIEATGWIVNERGKVELVADRPSGIALNRPDCSDLRDLSASRSH
jgi:filamentous hemagglutinin family protein